jgi:hypothetical protein
MKTTIAISTHGRVIVEPRKGGGVTLYTGVNNQPIVLTPDQAGALIFGLEQATEAAQISQQREAESFARLYPMGMTA